MKNQNSIVFFIGLIVMMTIAIQFYWNHLQYKDNKQQVLNEIQISLDNAIDTYYNELSKITRIELVFQEDTLSTGLKTNFSEYNKTIVHKDLSLEQLEKFPEYDEQLRKYIETIHKSVPVFVDSIRKLQKISVFRGKREIDSLKNITFKNSFLQLGWSTPHDSVYISQFQVMLDKELERKNFYFDFFLIQKDSAHKPIDSIGTYDVKKFPFVAVSNSVLLPKEGVMELYYPDIFWITLKKGITGILLSFVLSVAVIFSLFYLLYIIRKQKQLSEIKNDFISNITHELKTPIATVTSAVEGMRKFNVNNDPEKTQKYLDVSSQQLDKLKILVEKIMETSVLESKDLILEKEKIDLVSLINNTVEKHRINTDKSITFHSNADDFVYNADAFHFENALSNLIENAVKYGGNEIDVRFVKDKNNSTIEVSDNGSGIPKEHQKLVFDKFYRVPNKNKHNVKDFGIGLYYTKNIIEKHNATIELKLEKNTTFRIIL